MVTLEPGTGQAIKSVLAEEGIHRPLRIELRFSGCCDPTLGLGVDAIRESDLVQELDGLTFVISPETHQLAGEITISYVEEMGEKGFVLTPSKPLGEWDGFGITTIKT